MNSLAATRCGGADIKGGVLCESTMPSSFVSDMPSAVAFYRDVLGLRLKFESPKWTEFATDGATFGATRKRWGNLRTESVQHTVAGHCRPGLSVPNLDEFHGRMVEHKVPCLQAPTETFGARIAQYVDPDGLVISVSQQGGR